MGPGEAPVTPDKRERRIEDAKQIATEAIYKAMMFNLRAYGKLACEEDAEFFAACVLKALRESGYSIGAE